MRELARSVLPALAVVFLVSAAVAGCGGGSLVDGAAPGLEIPDFRLVALGGGEMTSGELDERPTVLSFWATWCQPCHEEIPLLNELEDDPRVRVVSIALDDRGERAVAPFVAERGIRYPVLLGDQEIFQRFDGFAIPYTLVLDAERRIVNLYRGPVTRADVERDLSLVAAAAAAGDRAEKAG